MWKEEEQGEERVSVHRVAEAAVTAKDVLAVACPFCMIMLGDAVGSAGEAMQVRDVVEILAERIEVDQRSATGIDGAG